MKYHPFPKSKPIKPLLIFSLLCFLLTSLTAQRTISGTVIDKETLEPLAAATILIKGTARGQFSDEEGRFIFENISNGDVLEFRFVGYATQEVEVGVSHVLLISMKSEVNKIIACDFGWYFSPFERLTNQNSIYFSTEKESTTSLLGSIPDQVPGIQVNRLSGAPGAGTSLRMRGTSHMFSSNEPLFVVDGLPIENFQSSPLGVVTVLPLQRDPLRWLATEDVASVQVLKGPESALYGARGANGVIFIKTNSPKDTLLHLRYSGSLALQQPQWRQKPLLADAYRTWAAASEYGDESLLGDANTDILNVISGPAFMHQHHLSVSQKINQKTSFLASIGYLDQQGTILSTHFRRLSSRFHFDKSFFKQKVKLETKFALSLGDESFLPSRSDGQTQVDALQHAFSYNPTWPVYNADNTYFQPPVDSAYNPVQLLEEIELEAKPIQYFGHLKLSWDISKRLQVYGKLALQRETMRLRRLEPRSLPYVGLQALSEAARRNLWYKNHIAGIAYEMEGYQQKLNLKLEFQQNIKYQVYPQTAPFNPFGWDQEDANGPYFGFIYNYAEGGTRFEAIHFQGNYNRDDKIEVFAGWRYERYNTTAYRRSVPLRPDYQAPFRHYPFISVALNPFQLFNIHLSRMDMRLRAAAGKSGIGPTTSRHLNLALDVMFKSWNLSIDAYNRRTDQWMLVLQTDNSGETDWAFNDNLLAYIENQGIEISLNKKVYFDPSFKWFPSFTTSFLKTRYRDLGPDLLPFGSPFTPQVAGPLYYNTTNRDYPFMLWDDNTGDLNKGIPSTLFSTRQQFYWKKFKLQVLAEGMLGFTLFNDQALVFNRPGGPFSGSNFYEEGLQSTRMPFYLDPANKDEGFEKGDYLRIRQIAFSYTWKGQKLSSTFSFSVENPFLWTSYTGNDPELALAPLYGTGQDYFTYPLGRIWTLGVRVNL